LPRKMSAIGTGRTAQEGARRCAPTGWRGRG
jgi:hypothetical protein